MRVRARRRHAPAPRRRAPRSWCAPGSGADASAARRALDPARSRTRAGDRAAAPAARLGRGRADALRARRRRRLTRLLRAFRGDPLVGARDPPPAVGPPAPPALALGGARLGGHRAADRVLARRRDPAPHRRPLGAAARRLERASRCATSPAPAVIAGRAPAELAGAGPGAEARAGARQGRARGRVGTRRPDARRVRPPPAGDPEIGPWTVQCLGSARPRRSRRAARRRPRLRQARRPPRRARPPRDGRGGRGVLRSLRAVPRPRRRASRSARYHSLVARPQVKLAARPRWASAA